MKKRWLVVLAAVGVLALGATGGVVLAQGGVGEDSLGESLISRVATKLGLVEADVQAAFDEAKAEVRDERVQAWLDGLVADGVITQVQADEYKAWIDARPEGLFNGHGLRGFGGRRHHGGHGAGLYSSGPSISADSSTATAL